MRETDLEVGELMFVINDELKKLPASPGVYIMHDSSDEIIYVGKAVSLKNRVRQYFQSSRGKSPKIVHMVENINRFEYIVTDSELEALVLENNLIKEHRPKYNTMLRDDKTYPYIKVTIREDYPRIFLTRTVKKDKAKYFGPFSSAGAVRDTLDLIRKAYGVRDCNRVLPRDIGKQRPCLNYHMHQCPAPCVAAISREEYRKAVDAAIELLNGNFLPVVETIKQKMQKASDDMDYEAAAGYRDLLQSLDHIKQRQKISSGGLEDRDIIALSRDESEAVVQVFFMRGGQMIGREHHYIHIALAETDEDILDSFIKQFYAGTPFIPATIMVMKHLTDEGLVEKWLSEKKGSKVTISVPERGMKEKLVELAKKNADMVLEKDRERLRSQERSSLGAVRQIEELIGASDIHRIEAYDISNISGAQSVGSMVVYQDGLPKKSDYRKFRIKTVVGANDYASLHEVLTRRLTSSLQSESGFTKLPDLILMDGGRGQVNIALEVMEELGLDIKVCGMVKDDSHRTRGLYYNNVELPIDTRSEAFKLITRIQDEAHRFAITYHRSLRSREQIHSVLDDIGGIGPIRRKNLLKKFGDVEHIKLASYDELMSTDGMNATSASKVYEFFHKEDVL